MLGLSYVASFFLGSVFLILGAFDINNSLGWGAVFLIASKVMFFLFEDKRQVGILNSWDERHEKIMEELADIRRRL